jgi:hypothetical protein
MDVALHPPPQLPPSEDSSSSHVRDVWPMATTTHGDVATNPTKSPYFDQSSVPGGQRSLLDDTHDSDDEEMPAEEEETEDDRVASQKGDESSILKDAGRALDNEAGMLPLGSFLRVVSPLPSTTSPSWHELIRQGTQLKNLVEMSWRQVPEHCVWNQRSVGEEDDGDTILLSPAKRRRHHEETNGDSESTEPRSSIHPCTAMYAREQTARALILQRVRTKAYPSNDDIL